MLLKGRERERERVYMLVFVGQTLKEVISFAFDWPELSHMATPNFIGGREMTFISVLRNKRRTDIDDL